MGQPPVGMDVNLFTNKFCDEPQLIHSRWSENCGRLISTNFQAIHGGFWIDIFLDKSRKQQRNFKEMEGRFSNLGNASRFLVCLMCVSYTSESVHDILPRRTFLGSFSLRQEHNSDPLSPVCTCNETRLSHAEDLLSVSIVPLNAVSCVLECSEKKSLRSELKIPRWIP